MMQRNRSVNRKSSGNYSSRITKKKKERVDINYKKRIAKIHTWRLNNVL